MPVRKRRDRRSTRVDFEITPAIAAAFRAYIDSEPVGGGEWVEHWILHDLLDEAGALPVPHVPPCCFHPALSDRWDVVPWAVPIYRHLMHRGRHA